MAKQHKPRKAEAYWVVLADEGHARVLEAEDGRGELHVIEELDDADARRDNAELRRDAYGRRGAGTMSSAGEDALDHEAEAFARRVAHYLERAHQAHRYEHLSIAAAPRFLGRFRAQLGDEVRRCVVAELDKDLLKLDLRTITQRLTPHPPPSPAQR